jgi:hypothetical protein
MSAAGLASRSSRFARAARDPQWTGEQSAHERAELAKQAAKARRDLAARRLAQAAQEHPHLVIPKRRIRPLRSRRSRIAAWLLAPLTVLVVLALLGSAPPVISQTRNAPSKQSIEEMHHLIDVAKEAGLTDEQIRQITIEDEFGNVINAMDYLQGQEKAKQAELARRKAEQERVYLTPQDIFAELRTRERADLDSVRDQLPYDKERYR